MGQLLRDILSLDNELLTQWSPLDHLIVIDLVTGRSPSLRRYSEELVEQIDGWMERNPNDVPLLYREWLRGTPGTAQAAEVLGSLGVSAPRGVHGDSDWAYRAGYMAVFRSIVLVDRARGVAIHDLERQWGVSTLDGLEEQWRDSMLWLLSGVGKLLDVRAFFFHLRESDAGTDTVKKVKRRLEIMRRQTFELREQLKFCSPLGSIIFDLRRLRRNSGDRIASAQTLERLESAGISSLGQLSALREDDLVRVGVQPRYARQIRSYVQRRAQ
jgi:helicase